MNPLVPEPSDIAWSVGFVAVACIAIIAFASLVRARIDSAALRALWLAAIVLLPLIGPALWFAYSRRAHTMGASPHLPKEPR